MVDHGQYLNFGDLMGLLENVMFHESLYLWVLVNFMKVWDTLNINIAK